MAQVRRLVLQSLGMLAVMTALTGVSYPLLVTGVQMTNFNRAGMRHSIFMANGVGLWLEIVEVEKEITALRRVDETHRATLADLKVVVSCRWVFGVEGADPFRVRVSE